MSFDDYGKTPERCSDRRYVGRMCDIGYRPVHVKTLRSQKLRMRLTHRKLLQSKAIVALARRLAVIMHRIWIDGTEFRWPGK
jgi:transposase